jgi:hypothetical protein
MTRFQTTIDIQAPPERVWAALRDIEHWSAWTPTVLRVRLLDPGPVAVGTRAIVHQPKLPSARWQITEFAEGHSFTWIKRSPGVFVTGRHCVEGTANGSRAILSLDFSGPLGSVVACLTRGLNKGYLALEAQGLKKHAEASARPQVSKR